MARRTHTNYFMDVAEYWQDNFIDRTNPIVYSWPLVGNDTAVFAIMLVYVLFVLWLGPNVMRHRKPFDLRWIMVPYNAALVVSNFYIFLEYAKIRWKGDATTSCETLDINEHPSTYRLAEISWWFYMSKYVELSDTVFFVLRKKERQLSKLHLIHHTCVPLLVWGLLRSEPGGYNAVFPLANSFVHVFMYTYYGISAIGDHVTIHLKFKRYITMLQLVQFIFVLYHMFGGAIFGCRISMQSFLMNTFIAGFFFILFCNFYWNEYLLKKKEEREMKENHENGVYQNGTKKL